MWRRQVLHQLYRSRLRFVLATLFIIVVLVLLQDGISDIVRPLQTYYVAQQGSDTNEGTNRELPLATIQEAIDKAQPGDIIELLPGEYRQDIKTVRSGRNGKHIILQGPPEAIVKGGGNPRIIEIQHSYITLQGFTVDGLHGNDAEPAGYREKLVYIMNTQDRAGITNVTLLRMNLKNSGGECVRIRHFASEVEVAYSNFYRCGILDYAFEQGGKNGEAIYIGTAPEQEGKGGAPSNEKDVSIHNYIHHNYIDPQGSECINIKENSRHNIITDNICVSQLDANSAAIDVRGSCNVIAYNQLGASEKAPLKGATVRIGGENTGDAAHNDIVKNVLTNYRYVSAVKFPTQEQPGAVCGNQNSQGSTNFGNNFADYSAISNSTLCDQTYPETAGPRGCVGAQCSPDNMSTTKPLEPSAKECRE